MRELEAELLRVRTAGHGAAHELDNIAVEAGIGHSPRPGVVAAYVRGLKEAGNELSERVQWYSGHGIDGEDMRAVAAWNSAKGAADADA